MAHGDGQTSNALSTQVKKEAPKPHFKAIYPRAVDTVYGPTTPVQIVGHPFHPRATGSSSVLNLQG
jgi:hypothetical protein